MPMRLEFGGVGRLPPQKLGMQPRGKRKPTIELPRPRYLRTKAMQKVLEEFETSIRINRLNGTAETK